MPVFTVIDKPAPLPPLFPNGFMALVVVAAIVLVFLTVSAIQDLRVRRNAERGQR